MGSGRIGERVMKLKSLNHNLALTLNPFSPSARGKGIKSKIMIKSKRGVALVTLGVVVICSSFNTFAQQPPPPPNPAAIMLSPQPNIDTTTPVVATAVFDPPVIRPDGSSTYRVSFNALIASVGWHEEVIAPDQLELTASARGEVFALGGSGMTPHAGFNYRVRARTNGSFTVPRFTIYVYGKAVMVPPATLEVVANPAVPVAPGRRLLLSAANMNPFVGENIAMRIVMPASGGGVQPLNPVKLIGEGFMTDPGLVQQAQDTQQH